jgi:hypothetical protein
LPPGFYDSAWQRQITALQEAVAARDSNSLRRALAEMTSNDTAFCATRNGKPDFEPVLDEISNEFTSLWTVTLPHILQLARMAPKVLGEHEVCLLQAGGDQSQLTLSRTKVATLLALAFLGVLPGTRASMAPLVWPKAGCAFRPNVEKLKCFLQYFDETRTFTSSNDSDIILVRTRLGLKEARQFDTLDGWKASKKCLRNMTVFPLSTSMQESKAPAHVDFSNSSVGGGIFLNAPGASAQEEILFATHPELCVATILAPEPLMDDEVLLVKGARRFVHHMGYLDTFCYAGPIHQQQQEEANRWYIAMDASRYNGGGLNRPFSMDHAYQIMNANRDLHKALCGFRAAAQLLNTDNHAVPTVATGNWGSGAFGGAAAVKALLQWMAASEADVDLEYFPWNDPVLVSELPSLVQCARCTGATVGMLMRALLSTASAATEEPNGRFCDDGKAFLATVENSLMEATGFDIDKRPLTS